MFGEEPLATHEKRSVWGGRRTHETHCAKCPPKLDHVCVCVFCASGAFCVLPPYAVRIGLKARICEIRLRSPLSPDKKTRSTSVSSWKSGMTSSLYTKPLPSDTPKSKRNCMRATHA